MVKITQFIRKAVGFPLRVADNVRTIGIRQSFAIYFERFAEESRERRLGIATKGDVPGHELSDDPACHCYQVVNYPSLDAVFAHRPIDSNRDVFIDYGCGKGRAVVVAATHPFRRVIGVEFAPTLAELARTNVVAATPHLKCNDVEIVTENAMSYVVPDDVNVLFLFNPFSKHVMDAVLQRIHESLSRQPRQLDVFYLQPFDEPNGLTGCNWLRLETQLSTGTWDKVQLLHYRNDT